MSQQGNEPSKEPSKVQKGGRTKWIAVAVVIVVIVAAGGVAAYYLTLPKKTTTTTVTVAAPIYGSSATVWENWINNATVAWKADHPGVKIKFVGPFGASNEGDYYTKLDLMTSSPSTAPSVMLEDMFYTATYASSHVLLPLNSYVNSSVISNEFPSALNQMSINNTYYGLPAQVTDTLIYYNMTLFKEAGLPVPWQPTNWSDIISAAETIHSLSNMSSVIPLNVYEGIKADEASSFTGFEGLLYGTGWGLYNFTAHKWYGENPGLLQTLDFYQQAFVNKSLASASLSAVPYVTVGQYLQEGKLAIAIDGSWMYGYQWGPGAQHPVTNFPSYIGVAKIPTEFGQSPGYSTMVGGWGWAVYNHTSNPSLAVSFAEALANTTNSITINLPGSALAGGLPTTKTAVNNPLFAKLMPTDPSLDAFYTNLLQYGNYRPPVAGYPKVSYQLDVAMSAVVHSTASPAAALSAYNSALISTFGSSDVQAISSVAGVSVAHNIVNLNGIQVVSDFGLSGTSHYSSLLSYGFMEQSLSELSAVPLSKL